MAGGISMKKKFLTMLAVLTVSAGVISGCSSKTQPGTDNNAVQENKEEEGVSEVAGTLDEIKDFMFVVTDDAGASYAFSFEEKPEGLDQVAVGDKVIVKYTGTISEVDAFTGEILSIEKQS